MLACASHGLPKIQPTLPTPTPPPESTQTQPNSLSLSSTSAAPQSEPQSEPQPQPLKLKGTSRLNQWSRARNLRAGRKLNWPANKTVQTVTESPNRQLTWTGNGGASESERRDREDENDGKQVKAIYIVSDGTGWTAEHAVNAALGQFVYCLVDGDCRVDTHLFSGVNDVERLMEIVRQAAKASALLVYTLADPSMADSAKKACTLFGVPSTDVLGPVTETIASHLGVSPSGIPRSASGAPLGADYFRRIEAVEFTIKQDDGALPQNLHKADIVLAGVSRTGKTPLSIYLAQKGYKTANIPIVMGLSLPKTLFEIDPDKVFGLTINPVILQTIRDSRAKSLGLAEKDRTNYSEMDYVRRELENAMKIYSQNPRWRVIEVTGKAVEESAAVILRLYHDRKQKCSMPGISKRY